MAWKNRSWSPTPTTNTPATLLPQLPSTKMKDHHFRPRRTSASHQPCSTERMVNPWYFTQLRLPVYKHAYMRRFHPYPCSKRRRDETDPWMDGFFQESTIRPTLDTDFEDENEESDAHREKGTIFLLVADVRFPFDSFVRFLRGNNHQNLGVSAERIMMSGRKM
ncbi:hypothetical protein BDN71DRAFT_79272 [Pleurotus eryngii]|uniref:Uncharacterized protein n=1 Tax=Pleurotus eryngii TaxID=5323 RepID=A0A9P6DCP7_PLEER|nr:hypothetical protein BDN71DRAFT_79272 [Pleurotus eryngii]